MKAESLKQKTRIGLYWKFLEQFANYGMTFIVGIIMARKLSPDDYGITALPAVFVSIAGIFTSAGFASAMIRKPKLTEEDLSTSFYYSTGMGIFIYVLLFFASPWIADFYNTPVLTPLMRVNSLCFVYGPMGSAQSIILQRRLDFKTPTYVSVVTKIVSAVVGIYMAYDGYGVWALTISTLIAGITGFLIQWYVVKWYPKTGWSNESFKYLWGFGNKFIGSQLIDAVYNNVTPIIVGKYFSTKELGVYNRAENYAKLPSQNLQGVIQSVTYPVLARMQSDPERLAANYRRIIKTIGFIVFPIMMLLAGLARPLILIMVTGKWSAAIILLQLLCFNMMWWPIQSINLNLLMVLNRTDLFLRLEIIKKIYGIVILVFTLPFGLVFFCAGRIVSSYISLFVNTYYNKDLIDYGFLQQLTDLLPALLLSFVTFAISLGCTYVFDDSWVQLIIGFTSGLFVYLIGAILFKVDGMQDALYMLKIKK